MCQKTAFQTNDFPFQNIFLNIWETFWLLFLDSYHKLSSCKGYFMVDILV